jgi:hypothetical protein
MDFELPHKSEMYKEVTNTKFSEVYSQYKA